MTGRSLLAAAVLAAPLLLASASAPAHAQTKRCGTVSISNGAFLVTTKDVSCAQARRVLRKVNGSPGRAEGFRCTYRKPGGAYVVTCTKGAKRIRGRVGT